MTTYKWTISVMYTVQNPDPNYVINAFWILDGTDGEYSGRVSGNTEFDSDQSSTFIPYNQLIEEIVMGWVQEKLGETGVADCESQVQAQIDGLKNPLPIPQTPPLPWAQ